MCYKTSQSLRSHTIQPSGTPSDTVAFPTSASSPNFDPVTKSTGRWSLTPFFSAFSISLGTISAPSSSYSELPIYKHNTQTKLCDLWIILRNGCFPSYSELWFYGFGFLNLSFSVTICVKSCFRFYKSHQDENSQRTVHFTRLYAFKVIN